jgi:hypothetical protein
MGEDRKIKYSFFKGLILFVWIILLVIAAGNAGYGDAYKRIYNFNAECIAKVELKEAIRDNNDSPIEFLRLYKNEYYNPPPLETIIDKVYGEYDWSSHKILHSYSDNTNNVMRFRYLKGQYYDLFRKMHNKLNMFVDNVDVLPGNAKLDILIPEHIFGKYVSKETRIPNEAIKWIQDERHNKKETKERNAIIDLSIIVLSFGAFGSLIFLTKEYMENIIDYSIATYIFRPFLGMFLGLSMFIIYLIANSIITTSEIYNIRKESLYILSLSAGLMSEHAYAVLYYKSRQMLDKLKKEKVEDV